MSDSQTRVVLHEVKSNQGIDGKPATDLEAVFYVGHEDGNVLVSMLEAKRTRGVWTVSMQPPHVTGNTITATAWELAEWMERMAQAIKDNTFDEFNLNGL